MGDFNINLFNYESHNSTKEFLDIMLSFFLYPLITRPTRITGDTATLIDNIFCNSVNNQINVKRLLYTDISDHLPIFTAICRSTKNLKTSNTLYHRPLTTSGKAKFKQLIANSDFDNICRTHDICSAFTTFHNHIIEKYSESFPLCKIKTSSKRKSWLSEALKSSIKQKNKLYMQFRKRPTVYNEIKYKKYRNTLKKTLIEAEKRHYQSVLETSKGNQRQSWKILKY